MVWKSQQGVWWVNGEHYRLAVGWAHLLVVAGVSARAEGGQAVFELAYSVGLGPDCTLIGWVVWLPTVRLVAMPECAFFSACDGVTGIGDPFAPGSGVEEASAEAAAIHGDSVMKGADAGTAVVNNLCGWRVAQQCDKFGP